MIYDCFPFCDEVDIVQSRMAAMTSIELHHLAVEANITHQGQSKPFHLQATGLFGAQRLTVVSIKLEPNSVAYEVERQQRDCLLRLLEQLESPDDDDLILSCDVDEIVRPSAIDAIAEATARRPHVLGMRHHWYSTKWYDPAGWYKARAFRWRDRPTSLTDARLNGSMPVVPDAGWHLSWFGGAARIHSKLRAFHHVEYNTDEVHAKVEDCLAEGVALTGLQLARWDGDLNDFPPGLLP